jgi:hypothetical protein
MAYVLGMQGDSLASDHTTVAEPKHFAGHGSPEGGQNTSPVHMGERELRSEMLKAFEPAFRDGHAMAAMAAYHEIDGIPVTADPLLLKTILRDEWGFHGFVLWAPSDGSMKIIAWRPHRQQRPVWQSAPALICSSTISTIPSLQVHLSAAFTTARCPRPIWIGQYAAYCGSSSSLGSSTTRLWIPH